MENEAETMDYHNKLKILPLILHQLLKKTKLLLFLDLYLKHKNNNSYLP